MQKPLYIVEGNTSGAMQIKAARRIGISSAKEKNLRFIISGSKYLSRRETLE
jgi:3-methyladenine DNA glycosylase Mpg